MIPLSTDSGMENFPTPTPNMPPVEVYSNQPTTPQASVPPAVPPPTPKKGFPKALLIIGALLLVAVLGFLAWKLISGRSSSGEANLVWWGLWEEDSVVAPLIAEYQTTHPKVKITYVKQSPQD